ncbi:MAG: hypothetical protein AAGA83_06525 [Cyanobacteria bacterium P01_F01_bin.116]
MSTNGTENWTNGSRNNGELTVKSPELSEHLTQENHGQDRLSETDALNSIRDILFGKQAREHERQLVDLENRLVDSVADLRNDLNQRLNAIEAKLERRLHDFSQQLIEEQSTRHNRLQALKVQVDDQTQSLRDDLNLHIETILSKLEQESYDRKHSAQTQTVQLARLFKELSQKLHIDA